MDAGEVTKSRESDTCPLERKPSISLKELMNVALGAQDEDTLTSLANRIIRLNSLMTNAEKKKFTAAAKITASGRMSRIGR